MNKKFIVLAAILRLFTAVCLLLLLLSIGAYASFEVKEKETGVDAEGTPLVEITVHGQGILSKSGIEGMAKGKVESMEDANRLRDLATADYHAGVMKCGLLALAALACFGGGCIYANRRIRT